MEDASKDKKQGKARGPSYKLKSDIELGTDLKKVFEERILNSKVELTLGEVLGIAKTDAARWAWTHSPAPCRQKCAGASSASCSR